jgi:endoglucanase
MINPKHLTKIAGRLLRHPASPYYENEVRSEVEAICAENGLKFKRDEYGNGLVRLKTAGGHRPCVLAAHMDHPRFEVTGKLPGNRWKARFLGGVPDQYFKKGVPVRLMPGAVPARLMGGTREALELKAARATDACPRFAVWELEDFSVRDGRIHARACDDTIGVAAILATLIELKRIGAKVDVIGLISRAEEVGFHGALTVMASKQLPKDSLVISLETSRELAPAKMGEGVIIRVGDKTSIFDTQDTWFLAEV